MYSLLSAGSFYINLHWNSGNKTSNNIFHIHRGSFWLNIRSSSLNRSKQNKIAGDTERKTLSSCLLKTYIYCNPVLKRVLYWSVNCSLTLWCNFPSQNIQFIHNKKTTAPSKQQKKVPKGQSNNVVNVTVNLRNEKIWKKGDEEPHVLKDSADMFGCKHC